MPKNTTTVKTEYSELSTTDVNELLSEDLPDEPLNHASLVLSLAMRAFEQLYGPVEAEEVYLEMLELSLQKPEYRAAICDARAPFDNHVPNMLAHRADRRKMS